MTCYYKGLDPLCSWAVTAGDTVYLCAVCLVTYVSIVSGAGESCVRGLVVSSLDDSDLLTMVLSDSDVATDGADAATTSCS